MPDKNIWRMIVSGAEGPSRNMAVDYALWQSVKNGSSGPALRFYTWKPAAVSIGYNQAPETVVDLDFCRTHHIPVVRRPTGGSAIFHDIELTYSFSARADHHPDFAAPLASYTVVCNGIRKGIEKLGLDLELRGFNEGKEPSYTDQACFVLSSRHDLVCGGKKIAGSAQRRDKESFLQHGSIVISVNRHLWEKIFRLPLNFEKIGSLNEFLNVSIKESALISALQSGFREYFGVEFTPGELTQEETDASAALADREFAEL